MDNEEKILISRIKDLAEASYTQNRYTFSHFLTPEELVIIASIRSELKHVKYDFFGGYDTAERQLIRFGSNDTLGYDEAFPISTLLIEPLIQKFSDDLSHRDFLGALMNLGIKRNVIGDIVLKDNMAYVFCLNDVRDFIVKELTRVKHTSIKITDIPQDNISLNHELEDFDLLVSSNRFDAIVAGICKLSRTKSLELFKAKKILLNNQICENNSLTLKPNSVISIRGFGKYIFIEEAGKTRKDRLYLKMKKYV